jgi:hypothetical protein
VSITRAASESGAASDAGEAGSGAAAISYLLRNAMEF